MEGGMDVLEEIALRLQKDGVSSDTSPEQRLCHLWQLLVQSEGELLTSSEELQTLRRQQATEMKEVENYVEHIRNLLEERESLTAEYERENDQLRAELAQMKHQLDSQRKEVVEMLEQEGLAEISQSSSSEQVAYMLVERATLLERLEAAERKLDTQTLTGNLREVHLQEELDHIRHTMGEELRHQQESIYCAQETMSQEQQSQVHSPWRKLFGLRKATQRAQICANVHSEELLKQRGEQQRLERDLEEASRRLTMAHREIRHLTDELDSFRKNERYCDVVELQKAKDQNERLNEEIRVLRGRVRCLDTERKGLLEMVEVPKAALSHGPQISADHSDHSPLHLRQGGDADRVNGSLASSEDQEVHKRCRRESEDQECRLREVQRRLQKLQGEHEELVERNEELEALLGEQQNTSKEERERHEGEVEGLRRKIKSMEVELSKKPTLTALAPAKEGSVISQQQKDASGERGRFLESRLEEEKKWRKQLEVDLTAAQTALRKDKEILHRDQEELKALRSEVQSLRAKCQQAKALSQMLVQVRGEKGVLEDKVAQLERAHDRLKSDLALQVENSLAQQDLRESRGQVSELTAQLERSKAELSSLEKEHRTLKSEMTERNRQVLALQRELSEEAQLRLQAEGQRQRLDLELQHVRRQQQKQQQVWLEGRRPKPEGEPRPASGASQQEEGISQLASLKLEMSGLHSTLEEERELASQHQLALQAQISEAHARSKSQDSVLQQKSEENKQLRQDLARTQNLFTSAERELRYEREKNLDLKKHNALLDQEKLKVCAELRQAQAKLSKLEQTERGQAVELQRLQQKSRELELQLARSSQSRHSTSSLQEELCAERSRLIAADKKVLELQQQMKNTLHQLRLEEARAGETSKMERESRDLADSLSAVRAKLQEEQLQRKLLEQREEELHQQVRSLRAKEASLSRTNSELAHRLKQSDARLQVLESEQNAAREERVTRQTCGGLQEELASSQQESERLQEELQQAMLQLDSNIRKYNEKQCQYKSKLHKAKQVYTRATTQRDRVIQKLENELILATSLSEREQDHGRKVTEENEKLLLEKRELLQRVTEAEEMGSNGLRTATTIQQRVNILEVENRQLQEKTLRLAHQVGMLERGLRNVHSTCSMEDLKKMLPSDNEIFLQTSGSSPKLAMGDPLSILDSIRRVKVGEHLESLKSSFSVAFSQPSELSYLNVTSPEGARGPGDQEDSISVASEDA
ncbi:coiled-coil domain-containing protein 30 isoform X3 [Clupea harengus]|uniref:Coiled-coil domain-containing protein 30 isoform X3 n=1 Tax=Clupea harengus TaxID=7950 RepID=A0A6P8F219_CLUHA|nr:coiled-coil domain-containing protein 30 isoform X3 [Clupea harengus]